MVSLVDGQFPFDETIDISSLSEPGNSVGVRFTVGTGIGSPFYTNGYTQVRHFFQDDLTVVFNDGPQPSEGEVTHGLLNNIIAFLRNIVNGIGNIGTAIVELPGKIVSALIDGLKSLFIPSEEDLTGIKDQYAQLLEERLGFVWQAGEMVVSFGQSVLSAFESTTDFQFEFPGVSFELPELGTVTLIEAQDVSVDNAFMDVMQPVLGTIVSFICVLAFINTAERMVIAVISGVSYFHFLKGD